MAGTSIFLKNNDKDCKSSSVDKFLETVGASPKGRLGFIIDATASRGPTWDMARGLTGDLIREAGRLDMQLIFFRGGSEGLKECKASDWISDPTRFAQIMAKDECRAGYTQIARALACAKQKPKVGAVVLIGDACESAEDNLDRLCREAKQLETPVFAFQEGCDPTAEIAFREIARLSGGAYGCFDANSAKQLGELLKAVAIVAVGGAQALEGRQDEASRLLLGQMRRNG
jgi:hypothetical protein